MRAIRFFIYLFSLLLFVCMIAGYFGWIHPALDSLSAFRLHFASLTLLMGAGLFIIGGRLGGLSIAFAALTSLYSILAVPDEDGVAQSLGARYRMMQVNVRFDNPTPKQLLQLIGRTKPDIITAQEVTPRWKTEFETIASAYPYQLFCDAHGRVGDVAIISKRPFVNAPSNHCNQGKAIAVQGVDFGGQIIQVASLHLYWPWPYQQPKQIQDMRQILATLKAANSPLLLAGDLNATRWSNTAHIIASETNSKAVFYHGGSWLAYELPSILVKWIGLPIDNLFASKLLITNIQSQLNFGSDHVPLLIEFQIPARSQDIDFEPSYG